MAELVLQAELGRELGSSATRRLRRENKIPGVLYGLGDEPVSVAVAYGELRAALSTDAGLNQLISLDLGSDKSFPGARVPPEKNPALGLRSMARGGDYDREHAEKFMWERVALQALVIVLLVAAALLNR